MNCALSTSRVFFYVLNVIFGLLGFCVLAFSIFGLAVGNAYPPMHNVIAVISGCIMTLASVLGCFGIHRTSVRFMTANIVIVGIVLVLQIFTLIRLHSEDISKPLTTLAENTWNARQFDQMRNWETTFQCCGLHGYKDYETINQSIPSSCYAFGSIPYDMGCYEKMREIAHLGVKTLKIASWVIVILEASLLAFGIVLANYYRNLRRGNQKTYNERF